MCDHPTPCRLRLLSNSAAALKGAQFMTDSNIRGFNKLRHCKKLASHIQIRTVNWFLTLQTLHGGAEVFTPSVCRQAVVSQRCKCRGNTAHADGDFHTQRHIHARQVIDARTVAISRSQSLRHAGS